MSGVKLSRGSANFGFETCSKFAPRRCQDKSSQGKSDQVKSSQSGVTVNMYVVSLARSSGPKPEIRRTRPSSWYTRSLYSVHTGVQASQELFMLDTHSTGEVWSASPWSRRDSGPSRPPAVCGVTFLTPDSDTRTSDVIASCTSTLSMEFVVVSGNLKSYTAPRTAPRPAFSPGAIGIAY